MSVPAATYNVQPFHASNGFGNNSLPGSSAMGPMGGGFPIQQHQSFGGGFMGPQSHSNGYAGSIPSRGNEYHRLTPVGVPQQQNQAMVEQNGGSFSTGQ